MKVTIEIDDSLLAEMQALATREGVDLSVLVEMLDAMDGYDDP